eukprot:17661-Heterococcus_DN1.PRE.6
MDKPGQAWSLRQLKPPKGLTVLQIASSDQNNGRRRRALNEELLPTFNTAIHVMAPMHHYVVVPTPTVFAAGVDKFIDQHDWAHAASPEDVAAEVFKELAGLFLDQVAAGRLGMRDKYRYPMRSILVLGVTIEMYMYSKRVDFPMCDDSDSEDTAVGTPAYVLQAMDERIAVLQIVARSIDSVKARDAAKAQLLAQQQGATAATYTDSDQDDGSRRCSADRRVTCSTTDSVVLASTGTKSVCRTAAMTTICSCCFN